MRLWLPLLCLLLGGCGKEVTDLIPARVCIYPEGYTGQGPYAADVASSAGLTLNGSAAVVDGVLRLTSATRNAVGSAYFSAPLALDSSTSLHARFAVRIGGGDGVDGADGLAFVLQSSEQGAAAIGLDGGGLGFQNVAPSAAIELDTYPNVPDPVSAPHVALMQNGDINGGLLGFGEPPFVMNDGVKRQCWVDYDASLQTLSVYLSEQGEKPSAPLFTQTSFSLLALLGPSIYAGFSASAGERFNDHDVVGAAWVGTGDGQACP